MRGYRHYSTSTVTSQYIITDPDRHMCSSYWMKCIGTSKTPTDGFRIRHSIALAARCGFFFVGCHGLAALGRGHIASTSSCSGASVTKSGAKERIGTGRENLNPFQDGLEYQRTERLRRTCRSNCAASLSMRCSSRCDRDPPIRRSANAVMRMDHCIIFFLNNGMAASFANSRPLPHHSRVQYPTLGTNSHYSRYGRPSGNSRTPPIEPSSLKAIPLLSRKHHLAVRFRQPAGPDVPCVLR